MSGPDGYPTDMERAVDQLTEALDRIAALLERIANAVAPTPEQTWEQYEAEAFERSYENARTAELMRQFRNTNQTLTQRSTHQVNAIAGEQGGRGVR